ncbi:hypothetical protein Pelo_14283 [Pelomyxa schiedti]|nr:hypothetical protein Pelo_14283 [Pelomyxa schiedti]
MLRKFLDCWKGAANVNVENVTDSPHIEQPRPAATVFGRNLGRAVPFGASLPVPVEKTLEVLSAHAPAQFDLFDLNTDDSRIQQLKIKFDDFGCNPTGDHPAVLEHDMQVVAGVLLLYFKMLPHPVIPPWYYDTVLRVAQIPNPKNRGLQMRVLLHMLPPVSRNIVFSLASYLYISGLQLNFVAELFAKYLLRPSYEFTEHVPPSCVEAVAFIMEYAEFMSMRVQEPPMPSVPPPPQTMPDGTVVPTTDFKLDSVALYDYSDTDPEATLLNFTKGDHIWLIDVEPNDWLEGELCSNGQRGFLPILWVKLVLPQSVPGDCSDPHHDTRGVV